MEETWETRVKKLALAYKTGWQYQPGSGEAGSVLTDLFLRMERDNQKRYGKIWEKHKQEFMSVTPRTGKGPALLKTALSVKVSGKADGAWLAADTGVYTVPEEGELLRFRTAAPVLLTAARLRFAIYRSGFHAWLAYEGEEEKPPGLRLFTPEGEELARPELRWYFEGLCDGREDFCFAVKFSRQGDDPSVCCGAWSISDGKRRYPVELKRKDGELFLCGQCKEFAGNLESASYELCLCMEEEPAQEWVEALYGGFVLEQEAQTAAPELCLTDAGGGSVRRLLPFGRTPDEAACCYFACDRVIAGGSTEITLRYGERFELEERLPASCPPEYEKIYKKYLWLRQTETVFDWKVKESVWEYFNGSLWCALPGSEGWQTGCCAGDDGERVCRWEKPGDMQPCVVEGEEHYFLRLRLENVQNAYTAYYRKYIPVMENISFSAEKQRMEPVGRSLPPKAWQGKRTMYLGFDRRIAPENSWYTGTERLSFAKEQLKGWGSRFGREAFWVELEDGVASVLTQFLPNYVEVLQTLEEENENAFMRLPAAAAFFAETRDFGVLDAVSVSDARPFGAGALSAQTPLETESYFSHYGRLVTQADLELLLKERFPSLRVVSCSFQESGRKLHVAVKEARRKAGKGKKRDGTEQAELPAKERAALLAELREWLEEALSCAGGLWFQGAAVSCCLLEEKEERGKKGQNAGADIVG